MYVIKKFENKYNEEVNQFIISIFVNEFGFDKAREELEKQNNYEYIKNGGNFWIALNEEENIIGTIALRKHSEKEVEIKKLYVREDYRGKGLSEELYNKAKEDSTNNNFNRIFLGTYDKLERAINFYLKKGFSPIDELYNAETGARYFELYI